MNTYDDANCKGTSWIFKDVYAWLLTTHNEHPNLAWRLDINGYIRTGGRVRVAYSIHPTVYLNSDVKFNDIGNGTSETPYQLYSPIEYVDFTITAENRHMIGYTDETTELNIPSTFQGEDGTWYRVTSIGDNAFGMCGNLTHVTIPDSVTTIGAFAFDYCGSLTSITIPDSVTTIGDYAFESCRNLTSINIPNSVTSIADGTFYGCNSLTSITIPDSVTSIGSSAFYGCSSLTSITIPDNVTTIKMEAFSFCRNLTSITIPDSVTRIESLAFGDCENLKDVYYTGNETQWNNITIESGLNESLINATKHFNYVIS